MCISLIASFAILYFSLFPLFVASNVFIPYSLYPFDIAYENPEIWRYLKVTYIFLYFCSSLIISNLIFSKLFRNAKQKNFSIPHRTLPPQGLHLYIGDNFKNKQRLFLPEKGLYQNLLVTGTIGSGKTSSAMYPFIDQLLSYSTPKLGMLILDVKGNFYKRVKSYAREKDRLSDLIIISLNSNVRYNPLDKPHLTPIVLANRLKTILTLFSGNSSESYWIDKAEQLICECIKLCRLYNQRICYFFRNT